MTYLKSILLFCIVLTISACSKKESTTNGNTNFTINGIKDVTTPANIATTIDLEIQHQQGEQQTVDLSISGLPDKVMADFSTKSGIPSYTTSLTITPDYAAEGTYPLVITASSNAGSETYNFNLVITAYNDCAADISGSYAGISSCSNTSGADFEVKKDNSKQNGIILSYGNYDMPATVNCQKKTIDIPFYTTSGPFGGGRNATYEASGTGTFNENNVMVLTLKEKFSVNGNVYTDETCKYTLSK